MEKGYQIKYIISIGGKIWITKCDMCTIICMPNVPLRSVKENFEVIRIKSKNLKKRARAILTIWKVHKMSPAIPFKAATCQ